MLISETTAPLLPLTELVEGKATLDCEGSCSTSLNISQSSGGHQKAHICDVYGRTLRACFVRLEAIKSYFGHHAQSDFDYTMELKFRSTVREKCDGRGNW